MHRKIVTTIWVPPLVLAAFIFVWSVAIQALPWNVVYWSEVRKGERIVSNIQSFHNQYGRLPNPEKSDEILPLGFELRIDYYPIYRVLGPHSYELEYYMGFDGPRIIYSSDTRQWHCELC